MSEDEGKKEDSSDEGWGDDDSEDAPHLQSNPEDEWQDPAAMEERLASMKAMRDEGWGAPRKRSEQMAAESGDQDDEDEQEIEAVPVPKRVSLSQPIPTVVVSKVEEDEDGKSTTTFEKVSDDDAPQWGSDDSDTGAPPSDMLAASGVHQDADGEAKPKRKKPKRQGEPLTPKQKAFLVGGGLLFVILATSAVLGYFNSKRYYLVCSTKTITAQKGRFWPWGRHRIAGPAFKALKVPSDVLCKTREYESHAEVKSAFLEALLEQSTKLLTQGEDAAVTTAEAQLEQALLLTRDPSLSSERELVLRLQGDVSYWRAAADVKSAIDLLNAAATRFEDAASKRPRHSTDAASWAEHARYIGEELPKGPRNLRKDDAPKDTPEFTGLETTTPVPPPTAPTATPRRRTISRSPAWRACARSRRRVRWRSTNSRRRTTKPCSKR